MTCAAERMLAIDGPVARRLDGFEPRPEQVQMAAAVDRLALTEDKRSGNYLFWQDTASSLKRLGMGLGIAAVAGLCLGIAAGTLPLFSAPLSPLLTVLSMVPPLKPPLKARGRYLICRAGTPCLSSICFCKK